MIEEARVRDEFLSDTDAGPRMRSGALAAGTMRQAIMECAGLAHR